MNSFAQNNTIETSGDVLQIVLPASAGISTVIWKGEDKGTLQFLKAFTTMEIVTHGAKRLIDKERPNGGRYAFPSGHTAAAFMGASFLQKRYGWEVGATAYLLSSYVGYTRIQADKHDFIDVIGGAAVGIGSTYLFTKPYGKNDEITITTFTKDGAYGLSLTFNLNRASK